MPPGTWTPLVRVNRGERGGWSESSTCASEALEKWGIRDGRLSAMVDHEVRGREDGGGKESGRTSSGIFANLILGTF